mmetsp:Transcript_44893/g.66008  ORF Transcript_44893/g.66008 Transcript_44893/m.66008 type:complete len:238 (+) Transcript_44893:347-1060(+)
MSDGLFDEQRGDQVTRLVVQEVVESAALGTNFNNFLQKGNDALRLNVQLLPQPVTLRLEGVEVGVEGIVALAEQFLIFETLGVVTKVLKQDVLGCVDVSEQLFSNLFLLLLLLHEGVYCVLALLRILVAGDLGSRLELHLRLLLQQHELLLRFLPLLDDSALDALLALGRELFRHFGRLLLVLALLLDLELFQRLLLLVVLRLQCIHLGLCLGVAVVERRFQLLEVLYQLLVFCHRV